MQFWCSHALAFRFCDLDTFDVPKEDVPPPKDLKHLARLLEITRFRRDQAILSWHALPELEHPRLRPQWFRGRYVRLVVILLQLHLLPSQSTSVFH